MPIQAFRPERFCGYGMLMVLNVIWVVFAGFWLWLAAIIEGVAFCLTIIGIPFGFGCFKIAKVSFAPLGKKVVSR